MIASPQLIRSSGILDTEEPWGEAMKPWNVRLGYRFRLIGCVFLLALLAGCPASQMQMSLVDAYRFDHLGANQAKGAIIYNHGKGLARDTGYVINDASRFPPPYYINLLRFRGWDVYKLIRPVTGDRNYDARKNLVAAVGTLRERGYDNIVLAGQSAGGWAALSAAQEVAVHAVIAHAPAGHGNSFNGRYLNDDGLISMLKRIKPTRLMLFLFAGDEWHNPGVGAEAKKVLEQRGFDFEVVDRPFLPKGHGGAFSSQFSSMYDLRIARFIDPESAFRRYGRFSARKVKEVSQGNRKKYIFLGQLTNLMKKSMKVQLFIPVFCNENEEIGREYKEFDHVVSPNETIEFEFEFASAHVSKNPGGITVCGAWFNANLGPFKKLFRSLYLDVELH
ncbi:MAG: hypothetical protein IIA73_11330 [Proteobacteria bacterium]|nr:hypothetical protein [Pseudomonadota bacterium]